MVGSGQQMDRCGQRDGWWYMDKEKGNSICMKNTNITFLSFLISSLPC